MKRRSRSFSRLIAAFVLFSAHPLSSQQNASEPQKGKPIVIPTRFVANQFFAAPITTDNVTLSLLTDSAGGLFLYDDTVESLKLTPEVVEGDNGKSLRVVSLPVFKAEHSIPPPLGSPFNAKLFVLPRNKKLLGDDLPLQRGASFLVRSVFEKWHQKHPEWRSFDMKTLTGGAMIEVPEVVIGGYKVGPVWFTVQSDVGFQEVMKPLMDKPIVGALGGSALHYFRLTVDWPNAIAVFDRR